MSFGARAVIRLGALQQNLKVIRGASPGARITAVIKANAYGHGIVEIASALTDVDGLAVARLPEALALRDRGIDTPLVILSGVNSSEDLATALQRDCEVIVHSEEQLQMLEASNARGAHVWLKVDTGMHRFGIGPEDVVRSIARLQSCAGVQRFGIMTHLASADDTGDSMTSKQLEVFEELTADFDGDVSVANSPALLGWGDAINRFHSSRRTGQCWARIGIALYGISPFADSCGADLGLKPVMQLESRIVAVKAIRAGDTVGYGASWRADSDTVIGLVSAGYGDGYSRSCPTGTPVLLNGRRVPLVGRVSMDSCAVDLGPDAADKVGDGVVLWGDGLPVEKIAQHAGNIPYELVCGVTHRESPVIVD